MARDQKLIPAGDLAKHGHNYPNESREYRKARTAPLAEEIELRRHIERVAEQRRALPPGGEIREDYVFEGANGPVRFSDLFGRYDTPVVYNFMSDPNASGRARCARRRSAHGTENRRTSSSALRSRWLPKSPIARLLAFKKERSWRYLNLYSSAGNSFNRDYFADGPNGEDWPHSMCSRAATGRLGTSGAAR